MSGKSRRPAITLAELVAVMGALGVLAAILTPALGDVRRRGKDTVCLQNLARIAQASTVYAAEDPEGQAVPVHPMYGYGPPDGVPSWAIRATLTHCFGGKSGRGPHAGSSMFWGTGFGRGPDSRPLNPVLYKGGFPAYSGPPIGTYSEPDIFDRWQADTTLDLAVYRCPSDTGYAGLGSADLQASGYSAFDFYGNSYNASDRWVGYGPGTLLSSGAPLLHRLSDVAHAAETLWYIENCGKFAHWATPQPANSDDDGYAAIIRGWHGQDFRFNVGFVDGHAGSTRIRGRENPIIGRFPGYQDPLEGYMLWHYVIARGPGWQVDTLPVPPVETDLMWGKSGTDQAADDCGDCPPRLIPEADLVATAPGRQAPEPAGATGSDVEG